MSKSLPFIYVQTTYSFSMGLKGPRSIGILGVGGGGDSKSVMSLISLFADLLSFALNFEFG